MLIMDQQIKRSSLSISPLTYQDPSTCRPGRFLSTHLNYKDFIYLFIFYFIYIYIFFWGGGGWACYISKGNFILIWSDNSESKPRHCFCQLFWLFLVFSFLLIACDVESACLLILDFVFIFHFFLDFADC